MSLNVTESPVEASWADVRNAEAKNDSASKRIDWNDRDEDILKGAVWSAATSIPEGRRVKVARPYL